MRHRPAVRTAALFAAIVAVVTVSLAGPASAEEPTTAVPAPAIVPFEQWAPSWCPTPTGADVTTTDRVVVHHSHNPTADAPDQVRGALAEICDMHVARGFDTIGYHYVVDPWGGVWQGRGRLPGRDGAAPTAQPEGAHVHGSNPGATGVVFLGDHQSAPPTAAAQDAAVGLLAWLVEGTGHDPADLVTIESTGGGSALYEGTVEIEVLAGHRDTNATLCPGEHLAALLSPIRDRVRATIEVAAQRQGGSLVASDTVTAAPPDGAAGVAQWGPLRAAPPPVRSAVAQVSATANAAGHGLGAVLVGETPGAHLRLPAIVLLVLGALLLVVRNRPVVVPPTDDQPPRPDVWQGWDD